MIRVLALETSCDETSVAVVEKEEAQIVTRQNRIASQIELHRPFGGVVPELATRQHLLRLDSMVKEVLQNIPEGWAGIHAVASTAGPGLASALLVGAGYGKAAAFAAGKPWLAVNHMEGHLFSPFLAETREPDYPHVALIVSGGHTLLILAREAWNYELLGTTRDDAAGEAFDKVGKMLGLAYPGGPEIEKAALTGDPSAFDFPRSMMDSNDLNFSFSGLKTAVRVCLQKQGAQVHLPDVCASFQEAVIEVLVGKTLLAVEQTGVKTVTLSGGVSCNKALRRALAEAIAARGLKFLAAEPVYSTDNAAMIGAVAVCRLAGGLTTAWNFDIDPNWKLAGPVPDRV